MTASGPGPQNVDPAPDAVRVHEQAPFDRHLGHVHKRDGESQVPPDAPESNVARIEQSDRSGAHAATGLSAAASPEDRTVRMVGKRSQGFGSRSPVWIGPVPVRQSFGGLASIQSDRNRFA